MSDGVMVAIGPCWLCGNIFEYDPETVHSILIDPQTQRAVDVGADGQQFQPGAEALARSVRQPFCPACVSKVNQLRAAQGLPQWLPPVRPAGGVR